MAWYDEAIFYHIYPLGLTDAPKENRYEAPVHRMKEILPWISHIKEIGCNAIYIGPLFESVGHGYETTDYRKLDSRLGDNDDLKEFVRECHKKGIRVILDGVFNHVGRDFFAFRDLQEKREASGYRDWFCNVNFGGNNEYNDGFCYENWGGYNLLVKLNQRNPAVRDYICDVVRFWASEFDIDGIRLDAADVLDFDYMKALRGIANEVKSEFWLMGEVIHGDYNRWVNEGTLHSVTNYHLHKALYSGHNDHNYFEIAHTVKRLYDMGGNRLEGLKLYNFVDNHDVERIYTKLNNKAHFTPVHILLYTLPGVPSIYYGSEFGIEGRKEKHSDASLRPALKLEDYQNAVSENECTKLIAALGRTRQAAKPLSYGDYRQLLLTNRQYAFSRNMDGQCVVVTVNNDDSDFCMTVDCGGCEKYVGALTGQEAIVSNGQLCVNIRANSGEIWLPIIDGVSYDLAKTPIGTKQPETASEQGVNENTDASAPDGSAAATPSPIPNEDVASTACATVGSKTPAEEAAAEDTVAENTAENAPATEAVAEADSDEGSARQNQAAPIEAQTAHEPAPTERELAYNEGFEKGRIAGLQEAILAIMEKNGNVTDQMRNDVYNNVYHDSLINWVKSFR